MIVGTLRGNVSSPSYFHQRFLQKKITKFSFYTVHVLDLRLVLYIKDWVQHEKQTIGTFGSSPTVERIAKNGILEGPKMFMGTDDLIVTPSSATAYISVLKKYNVPISDIEERVFTISEHEALKLLEASLTSKAVLTTALDYWISNY
ncbi:hypothetical protein IFM89_008390 [Coptis chinensis]|uniref:Uncharacterized protein n=1 Tax=Coptis chinensis TaxID=261450 RepID=A0A835LQW1_9MAGN|nr:hypothetical protein IFM89_008390 [Coptis chinensis]